MDSNNLAEVQIKVHEWYKKAFPIETMTESLLSIGEETGELMRAVLKQQGNIRGSAQFWDSEIAKEVGDIAISLICFCTHRGLNLSDCIDQKFSELLIRDYSIGSVDGQPIPPSVTKG